MTVLTTEEREYPLSLVTKIVYGLLAAVFFFFAIYLPAAATFPSFTVLSIVLVPLTGFAILFATSLRRKITITNNSIIYRSMFTTKELPLTEIKGYRSYAKGYLIEPLSPEYPRLSLRDYTDFARSSQLINWVHTNIKDLNAQDLQTARQQLIQDETLGNSKEERERLHKNAIGVAIFYNVIGSIAALMNVFFSSQFSSIVLLLAPLTGIFLLYTYKGLIKFFSNGSRSVYASVYPGIFISGGCLLFHSLKYYKILHVQQLYLPTLIAAFIIMLLIYKKGINTAVGSTKFQVGIMLLAALVYGFGFIREINGGFDRSTALTYPAAIKKHYTTRGKYGKLSYYLVLSPWGPKTSITKTAVSQDFYYLHHNGDSITVELRQGLLHIPWYWVEK